MSDPRARWRRARRHPWAPLLLAALASRIALVVVAEAAGSHFPQDIPPPAGWNDGFAFIHWFARWDSGWYVEIAESGYGAEPESWAFSPGYPLVIAALRVPLGFIGPVSLGFAISNLAFFADVVLLFELSRRLFEIEFARRAALVLAFAPGTVYLSAVYAESLFLLFCLACLIAITDERWLGAGVLAGLGALTRPTGLALFLAVAAGLALLWRRRRSLPLRACALAAPGLILPASFFAYSEWKTGNALISVDAREAFWPNTGWHQPLELLDLATLAPGVRLLVYAGLIGLLAGLVYASWDLIRRRHLAALPAYVFALASAVSYLGYSETHPILRYLIPFIPFYWVLAQLTARPPAFSTALAASGAIAAVVTALFATWGPLY